MNDMNNDEFQGTLKGWTTGWNDTVHKNAQCSWIVLAFESETFELGFYFPLEVKIHEIWGSLNSVGQNWFIKACTEASCNNSWRGDIRNIRLLQAEESGPRLWIAVVLLYC